MWLERIILKMAEKKLKPYRLQAEILEKELQAEYQNYLPSIERCYKRASYWHGTGRYHYTYNIESRYESVNAHSTLDVLDSIVKNDGLLPHLDPWISMEVQGKTVSLGTTRMHSRAFARVHQYEHDSLLYELGTITYWMRLYFLLLVFWIATNPRGAYPFIKNMCRKSFYRDIQTWASAIRRPNGTKVIGIFNIFSGYVVGSDISDNHPLLFGIAKDQIKTAHMFAPIQMAEVRSLQPVSLASFTHLEVPYSKVRKTKAFLEHKRTSLEVLPLEFVDIYLRSVSVRQLAYL